MPCVPCCKRRRIVEAKSAEQALRARLRFWDELQMTLCLHRHKPPGADLD